MNIKTLNAIHARNVDKLENLLQKIIKKNNNFLLLHNVYAYLYVETEKGTEIKKANIRNIFLSDELYVDCNFEDRNELIEVQSLSYDELYNILYAILSTK